MMKLSAGLFTLLTALVVAAHGRRYDDYYYSVFPTKTTQRRVLVDKQFGADTTTTFNPRSERSPFGWAPSSAFNDLQVDLAELVDVDSHGEQTPDHVVELVRAHSVELASMPFRVTPPPELLRGGSFMVEMRAMTRAQLVLGDNSTGEGAVARVEVDTSAQQVLPHVIPIDKAYWTDPNDDIRFATAGYGIFVRSIEKENNPSGLPSLGGAALLLTNKAVWAAMTVNSPRLTPTGVLTRGFVQVRRLARRHSATQWHSLAVQYDTLNNTLHFDVDGYRMLSVENYGLISDRMHTIQQISDGPYTELTPLDVRGLLIMAWIPDADDPLSKPRSNTGLLRLREEEYLVPNNSVPEAFAQRISLHRHRVFGHGMKMQLRRFSFFQDY